MMMTVQSGNEKCSASGIGSSADVSFTVAMTAVESDDDKNTNDNNSNTNNTNKEEEEERTATTTAVGSTTSNMTVFVWAGAILINGAFLALISYGTYTNWIIGFVISLVYNFFLFSFGFWIRKGKHGRRRTPSSTTGTISNTPNEVQEQIGDGEAEEFYPNNNSMLTNLLFLLAVIAIGCSGVYLPINLSSSCNPFADDNDYYTRDCILDTVTTPVPTSVATWWEQGAYQYSHTMNEDVDDQQDDDNQTTTRGQELPAGSFAYLPESDMTLYRGHGPNQNDTVSDTLWKVSGDRTGPHQISEMKFPHDFVVIDLQHEPHVGNRNETSTESIPATNIVACFFVDITSNDAPFYHSSTLACTIDGTNTIDTIDNDRDDESFFRSARGPIYLDDRNNDSYDNRDHLVIYFRADDSLCYNGLYSVDPTNLTDWTRHTTKPTTATMSILQEQQLDMHVDTECSNRELRMLFIWLLFLSAFPTVTVSFFIGLVLKVPSMVLAYFGSILWMTVCFLYVIAPNFAIDSDGLYQFFRWFPVVVSAPFLIVLTFGSLTKRISNQLLAWGINFYALVYTVGMFVLLQVFSHEALWRWIVLTVLGIIPLIVISLATNKVFLMVLAALGLMIEAGRLAFYIATVANVAAGLIISIVLAVLGITFGFVGFLLRKYHSNIQRKVQELTRTYLGRWIQPTSSPSHIDEHWP